MVGSPTNIDSPEDNGSSLRHVFGPVFSRRLGESLGVDPIPSKTCNWNCVYCQLGRTSPLRRSREEYASPADVLKEVGEVLSNKRGTRIDWVTFVGSGEPLLNRGLGEMIRGVKRLTDIPVAVITNGSLLSQKEVRFELLPADAVLPSFDAGTPALFRRINRPHPSISFHEHLRGLVDFRREFSGSVFLELMLVRGLNDGEQALREIASGVEEISPDEVHISLPDRPPAEPWVEPADERGLRRAASILGGAARVTQPGESILSLEDENEALESILRVIRRHPLSETQLRRALSCHSPEIRGKIMRELAGCGEAKQVDRNDSVFWVSSQARFPD